MASVPGTSRLYRDYITRLARVARFYVHDYRSEAAFAEAANARRNLATPGDELARILQDQNKPWGCEQLTIENAQSLAKEGTFVVVTGQQPGLFGGPLYTVYKALSTIQLAKHLTRKLSTRVIPAFWLVSEDHDFDEVKWIDVVDQNNELQRIEYTPACLSPRTPLHQIPLDESIHSIIAQLADSCVESEFKSDVLTELQAAYRPGVSMSDAFARWLTRLLKGHGVVLIDPSDKRLKALGAAIFREELKSAPASTRLVTETGKALLDMGYHAQLKIPTNRAGIFWSEDGRHGIEVHGNRFTVLGHEKSLARSAILKALKESPERFSANVVTRPIFRDYLLPTLAYIAGPAEVAYYAQLKAVYDHFQVPMPVIYPRATLTLVESKVRRYLERLDVQEIDVWSGSERLLSKVAKKSLPEDLKAKIAKGRLTIQKEVFSLSEDIRRIDPTLIVPMEKTERSMQKQMSQLEKRILRSIKDRDVVVTQQVKAVCNHLYPRDHGQERQLNVVPFLAKYGWGLIDRILNSIDLGGFEHKFEDL